MSIYSNEIGSYIDPGLVTPDNIVVGPEDPSFTGGFEGCSIVPLPDGRSAIVNSEGVIIGYK